MRFFSKPVVCPQGNPEGWTSDEVKAWLKTKGLWTNKHKEKFRGVSGQALLALNFDALRSKLNSSEDFQSWWANLSELQLDAKKYKPPPLPAPKPPPPVQQEETRAVVLDTRGRELDTRQDNRQDIRQDDVLDQPENGTPQYARSTNDISDSPQYPRNRNDTAEPAQFARNRNDIAESEIEESYRNESEQMPRSRASVKFAPNPVHMDTPTTPQHDQSEPDTMGRPAAGYASPNTTSAVANLAALPGLKDHAQHLLPWTSREDVNDVVVFLTQLGNKVGAGVSEALAVQPLYGQVFGSVMQLDQTSGRAVVSKDNCFKMAGFGQDILRILDFAGKKGIIASEVLLGSVIVQLQSAQRLLDGLAKPGWLMHVICNERLKEQFDSVHNQLIEILASEDLDVLPSGQRVMPADYRDIVRHVRRIVKQYGHGNLTAGVKAMRNNEAMLVELAQFFEIPAPVLRKEVEGIPESGLPIESLYEAYIAGGDMSDEQAKNMMYLEVFSWYDKDGDYSINLEEMRAVLEDLGVLEGRKPAEADALVLSNFRVADKDGDGRVDFEEFSKFYNTLVMNKARQNLRFKLGLKVEDELRSTFYSFASFGTRGVQVLDMDSQHFAKLCKDCNLMMDRKLTLTDVDLIFTKSKRKGERRITFDQFITALQQICEKKEMRLEELVPAILQAGGPVVNATQAEYTRFHDDKSTYTGVYARGGPTTVDVPRTLESLLDRSPADVRGVKILNSTPNNVVKDNIVRSPGAAPEMRESANFESFRERSGAKSSPSNVASSPSMRSSSGKPQAARISSQGSLRSPRGNTQPSGRLGIYAAFAELAGRGGSPMSSAGLRTQPVMDDVRFLTMCRMAGLVDATFTAASAEAVYNKAKPKYESGLSFPDFLRALELLADHKGCSTGHIYEAVAFTSAIASN